MISLTTTRGGAGGASQVPSDPGLPKSVSAHRVVEAHQLGPRALLDAGKPSDIERPGTIGNWLLLDQSTRSTIEPTRSFNTILPVLLRSGRVGWVPYT